MGLRRTIPEFLIPSKTNLHMSFFFFLNIGLHSSSGSLCSILQDFRESLGENAGDMLKQILPDVFSDNGYFLYNWTDHRVCSFV